MAQENLLAEIQQLDDEIKNLLALQKEKLQEWANLACPLKVGDVVEIVGYSHRGKSGKVESISAVRGWWQEYQWRVTVNVLKADGTPSKNSTDFRQDQWEKR